MKTELGWPDSSEWTLALGQAKLAVGVSEPNPRVGCVLTNPEGIVVGVGHTQQAGGPHAEVMALREAEANGRAAYGTTAWVTLEPCCHQGRTPPCTGALIEAGIAKVHVAVLDPNPLVSGQGVSALRSAGVHVEVLPEDHPVAHRAKSLNLGFFSRMIRQRPWVRMKLAASLDGKIALHNGISQWITSTEARLDGQRWRARASAVLTGIGTVLEDDPLLSVRDVPINRQPPLVVVDSGLKTPVNARLFEPDRHIWIYSAQVSQSFNALVARGARVTTLPDGHGKVDLNALLSDLATRGVNELHAEAGHKLNGSLIRAGLVDEFLIYLAPTMLGQGRDMAQWGPLTALSDALALEYISVERVGPDLRIIARPPGRDKF